MKSTIATITVISLIFVCGCITTPGPSVNPSLSYRTIDNADDTTSGTLVLNPGNTGFVEITDILKRSTSRIDFTYSYITGFTLTLHTKDGKQYDMGFSGDMMECNILPGRQWVRT